MITTAKHVHDAYIRNSWNLIINKITKLNIDISYDELTINDYFNLEYLRIKDNISLIINEFPRIQNADCIDISNCDSLET